MMFFSNLFNSKRSAIKGLDLPRTSGEIPTSPTGQIDYVALGLYALDPINANPYEEYLLENIKKQVPCGCNERIYMYKTIADNIGKPYTPKSLYVKSRCYFYAGATCYEEAAVWQKAYIDAGAFWDGLPNEILVFNGERIDQRLGNITFAYSEYAKSLQGLRRYEEALEALKTVLDMDPTATHVLKQIADNYRPKNDLDGGIAYLLSLKKSLSRKNYQAYVQPIIDDFAERKARGYVYRSRTK